MPTKEWTHRGREVEVDYTLHKAEPATHDTPGVKAYVEIEFIIDGYIAYNGGSNWDNFIDEDFEEFQADVLGGEK